MPIERAQKTSFITLSKKPIEVVSVQVRTAGTNFFGNTYSYTLTDKTIYLKKVYEEIKVDYNTQEQSGYDPGIQKNFLNGQTSFFGSNINIGALTTAGTTASSQRNSVEVSKNGSVLGLNVGGLVSLSENAQERTTTTDEPVVSVLTDTVTGVNLSKTSTNKNDISTLTGTTATDGFLSATITTGSPSGLNSALETEGIPPSKRKAALQESSTQPDVVEEVTVTTNPFSKITSSFGNQLIKTITTQNNFLGNPVGSLKLGSLGGFGLGGLGIPKTNMLGALVGKLLGIPGANKIGDIVPGNPPGVTVPTGINPPSNIIETTGNTNISSTVKNTNVIPANVQNTSTPVNTKATTSEWEGWLSTTDNSTYKFEFVGGPEELKSEFVNSAREITTMVVHWSRTFSNLNWGSKEIGFMHTSWQSYKDNLPPGTTASQRLIDLGIYSGLQYHYIIKKDGSIERGRPIDIESRVAAGFAKYAVHVAFVAGYTCPNGTPNKENFLSSSSITPEQWKSFREVVKTFDEAKNGAGEFVGFNQFAKRINFAKGPGFDVPEYMLSEYNKVSLYNEKDFDSLDGLSPQEIVTRKPNKVPVEPAPVNNPPPTTPAPVPDPTPAGVEVDELGNIIPSQEQEDRENSLWAQANANENRTRNEVRSVYDSYNDKLSDPDISETERNKLETEYYNLYENHRNDVLARQRLKVRLIEEGYVYKESTGKWIHGSRYYG